MLRRFAVILFADVVDYSLMMGEDEEATIALIRRLREKSLEPTIQGHGGQVLKRLGDGWIFAFSSVASAVDAAKEVQTELSADREVRLRMGMHLGDILQDEADVYGAGVNLAARLLTEAPPGGLMISDDVHHQLSSKQAEGFADAGTFNLKNIARPVQGFQWRPLGQFAERRTDEVPVIAIEAFSAAPKDDDTLEAAEDIRDQIIHGLSRRTGLRTRDTSREEVENATYHLRGRLRGSSARMRLNLSLILAADGTTSWTERYDSDTDDLFEFCDKAAAMANSDLRLHVNSLDNVRIADIPDENLSISELRTRGAGLYYKAKLEAHEEAVSVMARARRLDPDDGMVLSMWAIGVSMQHGFRFETMADDTLLELSEALDKSVERMPNSDFVFFARAWFRAINLRDREKTMADAQRSKKINPDYVQASIALGFANLLAGNFTEAVENFEAATRQPNDPYWPSKTFHKAVAQFCGDDFGGAIKTLRELIDLRPSIRGFRKLLILALKAEGREDEAKLEELAAKKLRDIPHYHFQEPPLPDTHLWLREALAPKDLS